MTETDAEARPLRIVIVDDMLPNALLAEAVLNRLGRVQVDIHDDPNLGLEACLQAPPDLILLDLVMPGLDGLTFLHRFRSAMGEDFIPVIMVTGDPKERTLAEAMAIGATDFLRKPWNETELEARARNMLSLRRSHLALRRKTEELRLLATTDSLTGVLNRRAFGAAVDAELDRTRRYDRSACLMMLDIDFFKKINDTYDHAMGDEALRVFASHCQSQLREVDLFGRLGGEEFAGFLPETSSEEALVVANRLRMALKTRAVVDGSRTVFMTVSIGLAQIGIGDTLDDLLRRADDALYLSKKDGRDRVTLAPYTQVR
ncbi:diguanylate cyclase [Rhodospirillum sp. A1_3_36]|uniref:GGDEF domain-containing response regulator n=1 Tax=Rhodospirillum sp. A1_3_36 TaxID=3391666 RepID=UPI0039A4FD71